MICRFPGPKLPAPLYLFSSSFYFYYVAIGLSRKFFIVIFFDAVLLARDRFGIVIGYVNSKIV